MTRRTPYERILRAAARGTGCRLSSDDVATLASDTAIACRGSMDAEMGRLPEDERDHYECFVPRGQARSDDIGTCPGDGWHRCQECGKFKPTSEGVL